jgi:hypothetical protein
MRDKRWLIRLAVFTAAVLSCRFCLAAGKPKDYCALYAKELLAATAEDRGKLLSNAINITENESCFFQVSLSNPDVYKALSPSSTSAWTAVNGAYETLSGGQQQGSSLSSSGSTNSVSKPSGPTSLIQEFGGANVTRGTSSTTVQWSPGTMLTNLALTDIAHLCLTSEKNEKPCISYGLLSALTPLTLKLTANTSSGTPSMTGTAVTPTSTASAQQVTVNSQGTKGPSLAGFTAQYSFFSRKQAGVKAVTNQAKPAAGSLSTRQTTTPSPAQSSTPSTLKYYQNELLYANNTSDALDNCDVYKSWKGPARTSLEALFPSGSVPNTPLPTSTQISELLEQQYKDLLAQMLESTSCQAALKNAGSLFTAILEAEVYEDFDSVLSSSAKPELALEYDLNSPQNKPAYSSFKATGNWQFGKSGVRAPSNANGNLTSQQQKVRDYAATKIAQLSSPSSENPAATGKQASPDTNSLAKDNTQPFSLTLTGTADVYSSEPSSSIPSASHLRDIQAGAEIAWVFNPFGKTSVLGKALGSLTLAGAYSYEDQTSPAILTGPALSDFTGLPTSTTSAYAQRGVIHLGQLRLGLGSGKNYTFPLAFTYSNRSELITHPTWGLQFGISYNLTSLFSSSGTTKSGNQAGN